VLAFGSSSTCCSTRVAYCFQYSFASFQGAALLGQPSWFNYGWLQTSELAFNAPLLSNMTTPLGAANTYDEVSSAKDAGRAKSSGAAFSLLGAFPATSTMQRRGH
jgi:hypothetical protein